jgi:hypothetical protein
VLKPAFAHLDLVDEHLVHRAKVMDEKAFRAVLEHGMPLGNLRVRQAKIAGGIGTQCHGRQVNRHPLILQRSIQHYEAIDHLVPRNPA